MNNNINNTEQGFVYLVQPAILIGTNRFKIGCSKDLSLNRLKGYLNGAKYLCIFKVKSPFVAEKLIKNTFNLQYTPFAGCEYYEGDEKEITLLFLKSIIYIAENSSNDILKDDNLTKNDINNNDSIIECDTIKSIDSIDNISEDICTEKMTSESSSDESTEDNIIDVNTYTDMVKYNDWPINIVLTNDNYEGYIRTCKYQPWRILSNKYDINFNEDTMETLEDFLTHNLNHHIFKNKTNNTYVNNYNQLKNTDDYNVYHLNYNMNKIILDIKNKCLKKKVKFYNLLYNEYLVVTEGCKYFIFDSINFSFNSIENINNVLCGTTDLYTNIIPDNNINISIIDECLGSFLTSEHIIHFKKFMYHLLVKPLNIDNIFMEGKYTYLSNLAHKFLRKIIPDKYDCINPNTFKNETKLQKYIDNYKQNKPRCVFIQNGNIKVFNMIKKCGIKIFILTDYPSTRTYNINDLKIFLTKKLENIKNQCLINDKNNIETDIYDIFTSSHGLLFNFIKWCTTPLPSWISNINTDISSKYNNNLSWCQVNPNIQTCKHGPNLYFTENISSHDIIKIINKLHILYGQGYLFEPEPIREGGIIFKQWPGKVDNQYKSFRLHFNQYGDWPRITDNTLKTWTDKESFVIWRGNGETQKYRGGSYIKAFRGAPKWTKDDKYKFSIALADGNILTL